MYNHLLIRGIMMYLQNIVQFQFWIRSQLYKRPCWKAKFEEENILAFRSANTADRFLFLAHRTLRKSKLIHESGVEWKHIHAHFKLCPCFEIGQSMIENKRDLIWISKHNYAFGNYSGLEAWIKSFTPRHGATHDAWCKATFFTVCCLQMNKHTSILGAQYLCCQVWCSRGMMMGDYDSQLH